MTACLVALAALPAQGSIAAGRAADDTIFVRQRHSAAICAGYCPHFELRVEPTGRVMSRSLDSEGRPHHYRVSARALNDFRRILSAIRPSGDLRLDVTCGRRLPAGVPREMDDPRPDDLEVRWTGTAGTDRLTGCGYNHVAQAMVIQRALRALGANGLSGNRRRNR